MTSPGKGIDLPQPSLHMSLVAAVACLSLDVMIQTPPNATKLHFGGTYIIVAAGTTWT